MNLATDPPVSEKQRRAMYAAAGGHSTLGIPQSVGKEFINADDYEESKHPRDRSGKWTSGGGGGGAAPEEQSAAAARAGLMGRAKQAVKAGAGHAVKAAKQYGEEDAHILANGLHKAGSEPRRHWAQRVRQIALKNVPHYLMSQLKEEGANAAHGVSALGKLSMGRRDWVTPEEWHGLKSLGIKVAMTAASMALFGEPTGTVMHMGHAFGHELVHHAALEHLAKAGIGAARAGARPAVSLARRALPLLAMRAGTTGDQASGEYEFSEEDLDLVREFLATLADVIENHELDDDRAGELLKARTDADAAEDASASWERIRDAVASKADDPDALASWIKRRNDPGWTPGDADFEESKHPRGEGGKFTSGQASAHSHLTAEGHEHKLATQHPSGQYTHGYHHPLSGVTTQVAANGEVKFRRPDGLPQSAPAMTPQLAKHLGTRQGARSAPSTGYQPSNEQRVALRGVEEALQGRHPSEVSMRQWLPALAQQGTVHIRLPDELTSGENHNLTKALIAARHAGLKWRPTSAGIQLSHDAVAMDWRGAVELEDAFDPEMAFDRDTVRDYSPDGHLRISDANISKATVNPYMGHEIPHWQELGLDPDHKYMLLRHPDELANGAASFNNLPILSEHRPVTADSHPPELVIGATGDQARFEGPYLKNSLVFWPRQAIDGIESNSQKQLSSAYRYTADMTPGVYEGMPYDGVMRNLIGNHVALVKEGRAGDDVVVGDSMEGLMNTQLSLRASVAKGALAQYIMPKLAEDAKPRLGTYLNAVLKGSNEKNWNSKIPAIARALRDGLASKLAQDADLGEAEEVLEAIQRLEQGEGGGAPGGPGDQGGGMGMSTEPSGGMPPFMAKTGDQADADKMAKVLEILRHAAVAPEVLQQIESLVSSDNNMLPGGMDEDENGEKKEDEEAMAGDQPPDFAGMPTPGGGASDGRAHDAKPITKGAMDAAIKSAVEGVQAAARKNTREIREAERFVRPLVGELALDSCETAEEVYRNALTARGVKTDGVHPSAYRTLLEHLPRPKAGGAPQIAVDAAPAEFSFEKMFPEAARIGRM